MSFFLFEGYIFSSFATFQQLFWLFETKIFNILALNYYIITMLTSIIIYSHPLGYYNKVTCFSSPTRFYPEPPQGNIVN